jgi:Tol biopolymer transport system component
MSTGAVRTYPTVLRAPERPVWQPDGRAIVFNAVGVKQRGQFRIDLDTGASEWISLGHSGGFTPDGRYFFHPAQGTGGVGSGVIMRRKLADGAEEIVDRGRHRSMVVSPDGRWIVVVDPGERDKTPYSISIVPSEGGERKTLVRGFREREIDNEVAWSHDSRFVLFTTALPPHHDVWRVPITGGSPERVGITVGWVKHISPHPDGRRLALSVIGGAPPEVWVWENLLSKGK